MSGRFVDFPITRQSLEPREDVAQLIVEVGKRVRRLDLEAAEPGDEITVSIPYGVAERLFALAEPHIHEEFKSSVADQSPLPHVYRLCTLKYLKKKIDNALLQEIRFDAAELIRKACSGSGYLGPAIHVDVHVDHPSGHVQIDAYPVKQPTLEQERLLYKIMEKVKIS